MKPSREIFMQNGGYLMCEQVQHTLSDDDHDLTMNDYLLMFHPSVGYFIAQQRYGTWGQMCTTQVFDNLKVLLMFSRGKI